MSKLFHRHNILFDAEKAWQLYCRNPSFFNFPERITLELTNRCNLRCFMCPRNGVDMKLGDMEFDLFKKIIEEAEKFLPVCLVPFFRGESLLHPNFLEMIRFAKERGLGPIQLATNAVFLSFGISRELLKTGIDFISFSIDVNDPSLYEKIRVNSDYEKVFSQVMFFLKEKRRRKLTKPLTQVSAVKTEKNGPFIREFVNFWKGKVDRVRIYYSHSLNGHLGQVSGEISEDKRKPCLKLLTDMVIYWNGDVAICNHDWQRPQFIGNAKQNSLQDIWNSDFYHKIREKHLENKIGDFSPCNFCSHWKTYYKQEPIIGEVYEEDSVSVN